MKRSLCLLMVALSASVSDQALAQTMVTNMASAPIASAQGAAAGTAQAAPTAQATPDAEAAQSGPLGDIVVTATRREERLQNVPVAITAIAGTALQAVGVADIRNLTQVVPAFFGGRNAGLFLPSIRGVGSQSVSAGDEPNVATYIDGVYQPDPFSTFIDLAEVERVEVLRGPQGTVFGRNATGGLINVITPDPEFNTSGHISARYGRMRNNANDYDVRGYGTAGLTDDLAVNLSGVFRKTDGFIKDLVRGGTLGDIRVADVRSKLLYKPTDRMQFILTGEYANQKSSTNSFQPYHGNAKGGSFAGAILPTGPWETSVDTVPVLNFERYNVALRTKIELGAVNLETTTGYMHNVTQQITDSDSTNIFLGVIRAPTIRSQSISQEIRLLSANPGPFQWLVGFYAFRLNAFADIFVVSAPAGPTGTITNSHFMPELHTTSYAGFAEGTYEIVPKLFLTGGIRYTWEKRELDQNLNSVDLFGTSAKTFDKVTYHAAARYNFSDRANIYASFSTGYKSGVFNYVSTSPNPVKPETITSYEGGLKVDPLPWLRTNLAVFYYDYKNLQLQARDATGSGYLLQNAASARIYGGELEITAKASSNLNIHGAISYTHANYSDFPLAQTFQPIPGGGNATVAADASGNEMVKAPRTTENLGVDWGHELGGGRFGITGNAYHSASVYFDFANLVKQKPYTLLSSEISWTTPDQKWKFSIWGTNLTNEVVYRESRPGPLTTDVTLEMPRRIGVGANFKF